MKRSVCHRPQSGSSGTRVTAVAEGSIAQAIGIRAGDRIVSLNGHRVQDVIDCWFHQGSSRLKVEWMAAGDGGSRSRTVHKPCHEALGVELEPFPIRRCNNKCVFCFVHQLPRGLRRELYVRDEDYRLSFLHGNYITCTNLGPDDLQRIARMKLSPLYVSIHATDEAVRSRLLGNSDPEPILPILGWLTRRGIVLHGQIVLCPGINDGTVLEKTVADLAGLFPKLESLAVVPVGLTVHRGGREPLEAVTPAYARRFLQTLARLRRKLARQTPPSFLLASDEFYLLADRKPPAAKGCNGGDSLPQISNGVGMHHRFHEGFQPLMRCLPVTLAPPRRVAAITTWMGARVIDRLVRELNRRIGGLEISVLTSTNSLFGPAITVTGLLAGADFLRTIRANPGYDLYAIPGNALRPWDARFLDGMTLDELEAESGAKVAVGDETCAGFAKAVLEPTAQAF